MLKPGEGPSHQPQQTSFDHLRAIRDYIAAHRPAATPFDIVVEGVTPYDNPDEANTVVREWAQAGATWWNEAMWGALDRPDGINIVRKRIEQGPPRF